MELLGPCSSAWPYRAVNVRITVDEETEKSGRNPSCPFYKVLSQQLPVCEGKHLCRDSSVGVASLYGLDGPGIESWWGGEIFHTRRDRPTLPPARCVPALFPQGVKRSGYGFDRPLPYSAMVKERVDLYLYSPGHRVAQLVETLCCKPEGRGFDSRWCHWNFSFT